MLLIAALGDKAPPNHEKGLRACKKRGYHDELDGTIERMSTGNAENERTLSCSQSNRHRPILGWRMHFASKHHNPSKRSEGISNAPQAIAGIPAIGAAYQVKPMKSRWADNSPVSTPMIPSGS